MENTEEVTVQATVSKKKPVITIELDKTGPYLHVTIPEYNGWIQLYINDKKHKVYNVIDGLLSIQLSGPLPREYRFRAEVLKK